MASAKKETVGIKTRKEIEVIREGGKILHGILLDIAGMALAGVNTWQLSAAAEKKILAAGGIPSFKGVGGPGNPFPAALCTSINDVIVHGIPSKSAVLENGDIVGLDIGMKYKGLFTDTAVTIAVGVASDEAKKLMEITKKSLVAGIDAALPGNTTGDIGFAVQKTVEAAGLNVIRDLVGHGVGYDVHEDPMIPNYGRKGKGEKLIEGMVIAIEPMVVTGSYQVAMDRDGWTIRTADGGMSAHFEHTVAITSKGASILT